MSSHTESVKFDSFSNVVNGLPRSSDRLHHGLDPTTKQELWNVPIASAKDVEDAIAAGRTAFQTWSKSTFEERQRLVKKFRELLASHSEDLKQCLISETGKPKNIADIEIHSSLEMLDWYISLSEPVLPGHSDSEKTIKNVYEPLGVVVAITPWNFPLLLPISKAVPALLMGNVAILKPSPFTPYTALKAAEIAQQVFPAGVIQALNGDDSLGPTLVNHPGVDKISFTGSTATGKRIMADSAGSIKRITLELGGNDPCIVLPDVDVKKAAFQVALGGFFNSGQVCVATKRVFVHEKIYKEFIQAISGVAGTFKVGNPYDEGVMMGPIQNAMQFEKLQGFIEDSKTHGYKFTAGAEEVMESKGYFIQPTVLDNPPADSYIFSQEQFGPILPCQPWSDEEEVIRRANDTSTGLGATVFGNDKTQTDRIARGLQCGQIWINSFPKPAPQAHFGGHKQSGIGTENGTAGILAYSNIKSIYSFKGNAVAKI